MKSSYDDEVVFTQYLETRKKADSPHNKSIKENLMNMVGSVNGLRVLDLGCGVGEFAKYFSNNGARRVIGIDISEKVLNYASKNNNADNIEYRKMDISNLNELTEKFDIVFSDMVVNYIEDYNKLLKDVYNILEPNGILVFSQVHPISTASLGESSWVRDENDKLRFQIDNYSNVSHREREYFGGIFDFYHRRFEELINGAIENNFMIEKILEPHFTEKEYNRPSFLVIKVKKK